MPTYVTLHKLPPEKQTELADASESYERSKQLVEAMGGDVIGTYYGSIGDYDAMTITEYPDAESAAKAKIAFDRTAESDAQKFRVHTPEEYFDLIEDVVEE